MTFDDMLDKLSTNESGIMYRAGVKKYGKAGMKAIQSAAGKGASHQEIGKIKDKHLKDEVGETATVGATAAGNIATVANPHIANSKAKPKKQKPTDNALDNKSHGLFGQPLKRLNNSKEVKKHSPKLVYFKDNCNHIDKIKSSIPMQKKNNVVSI